MEVHPIEYCRFGRPEWVRFFSPNTVPEEENPIDSEDDEKMLMPTGPKCGLHEEGCFLSFASKYFGQAMKDVITQHVPSKKTRIFNVGENDTAHLQSLLTKEFNKLGYSNVEECSAGDSRAVRVSEDVEDDFVVVVDRFGLDRSACACEEYRVKEALGNYMDSCLEMIRKPSGPDGDGGAEGDGGGGGGRNGVYLGISFVPNFLSKNLVHFLYGRPNWFLTVFPVCVPRHCPQSPCGCALPLLFLLVLTPSEDLPEKPAEGVTFMDAGKCCSLDMSFLTVAKKAQTVFDSFLKDLPCAPRSSTSSPKLASGKAARESGQISIFVLPRRIDELNCAYVLSDCAGTFHAGASFSWALVVPGTTAEVAAKGSEESSGEVKVTKKARCREYRMCVYDNERFAISARGTKARDWRRSRESRMDTVGVFVPLGCEYEWTYSTEEGRKDLAEQ